MHIKTLKYVLDTVIMQRWFIRAQTLTLTIELFITSISTSTDIQICLNIRILPFCTFSIKVYLSMNLGPSFFYQRTKLICSLPHPFRESTAVLMMRSTSVSTMGSPIGSRLAPTIRRGLDS